MLAEGVAPGVNPGDWSTNRARGLEDESGRRVGLGGHRDVRRVDLGDRRARPRGHVPTAAWPAGSRGLARRARTTTGLSSRPDRRTGTRTPRWRTDAVRRASGR